MDEKNSNPLSTPCPSSEALSIFLDEPSDPIIAKHLAVCEKCQAVFSAYDQVDRLLREQSAPATDLSARIQGLCRQQSGSSRAAVPSIRYPGFSSWLRIAAGLVVLAGGAAVLTYVAGPSGPGAETVAARRNVSSPLSSASETLNKIEKPLPSEVFSLTDQMRLQGNIDTDALQNVSTGARAPAANSSRRKYRIASQVEHIWLVDQLPNGKKLLSQLAGASGCQLTWLDEESPDSVKAILNSSDKNIQTLVNNLKDLNWVLMSPAYPQPHASEMALLNGNPVQYQATLVKKE